MLKFSETLLEDRKLFVESQFTLLILGLIYLFPKVWLIRHFYSFSIQFKLFPENQLLEFSEILGEDRKV